MSCRRVSLSICCLIFTFFCMQFSIVVDAASDNISQGQNITYLESIVSAGKIFELGFFTLRNSTNYYLGIWYHKISPQTIVWVANRDQPLKITSAVLTINNEGNLMIMDGRITYRVSENSLSQNTSAILLDSGNLVVRNENLDMLWQSFDYPSNTFLPGMKIGYNRKTGKVWSLTSWKNAEDPSLGTAELKMDPKQPKEYFLMSGSQIIWRSGVWLWDDSRFDLVPEMRLNYIYNFSFYSDENETYFTYSVKDSTISRLLLDTSGWVQQSNWLESQQSWFLFWAKPRENCNSYAYCGPFSSCRNDRPDCLCLQGFRPSEILKRLNQSGGCERRIPLQCEDSSVNGDEDRFLEMNNVEFPYNAKESKVQAAEECRFACFNDCTCTAYAYNETAVCSLWYGELLNLIQRSEGNIVGKTIYIKLAASEFQNRGGQKKLTWVIALVVALSVLLPASYIIYRRRRKLKEKEEMERSQDMLLFDINMSTRTSTNELSDGEIAIGKSKDPGLPLFSFSSVSAATDNFSIDNKLGEGGFGPVYKGKLLNGQEVAVKRLSRKSGQGLEELKNETMLIAKLQHRNLVRILGCCIEHGEKILIYEFMPNKSLDTLLFDPTKKGLLNWGTRVRIIEGIAQGLLYLHQYSRFRIIHRDLKASNILLDCDMNPKISDFGMARMFGGDELQANTNRIVGTYGYMSPEYAMEGLFSIKSDVFSFGILLLEILSSKKNTGFYNTDCLNLLGHAWELWNNDRALDLMDPILKNEASFPMLIRYINVALLCVQEIAADRPTMSEVVSMLTNEHIVLPSPKQPAFSYVRSQQSPIPHKSSPEVCSVNNVTVSLMEAR
ncbi:hypothetical protein ACOSQ4_031002 [Xanthoceras sorbifolium]